MEDKIIKQLCLRLIKEKIVPPAVIPDYTKYNEEHRLGYITTSLGGLLATSFPIPFIIDKLFNNRLGTIGIYTSVGTYLTNLNIMRHYNNMIVTGMLCCVGSILIRDLMAYLYNKRIYGDFLKIKCRGIVNSKIKMGDYELDLSFEKSDNGIIIDGPATIYKNGMKIFKGTIKCDGLNCELIRDNN